MTAAAPSPGLTNPTTAALRLLAAVRWLALLLLIHWLIACGRKLTAVLRQGANHPRFPLFAKRFGTDDCAVIRARIAGGLRRAAALEAELFATGPADPRLEDLAHCRAIGAQIIDIGRELGVFRDAPTPARTNRRGNIVARHCNRAGRRWSPSTLITLTRRATAAPATCVQPSATGPPASQPHHIDADTDAGVPWSFSRRTSASFSLYALS